MSKTTPTILLVEDDPSMARAYLAYLDSEPYEVTHVATGREALAELERSLPDLVLLDLRLPDMEGFEILRAIAENEWPTAPVMITGHGSISVAVEAMQLGAREFLVKPFSKDRLVYTLKNVLERQQLSAIVQTYREEIDRHSYCGFIGSSLAMQKVYRIIDSAAATKATVFVTGESGTGKEVCAEAIHRQSPRAKGPFIAVNCGAIPKDLMESELFGHVKGAFSGAIRDRDGAARVAHGGTLFLDEICEMELALQPKLLRFLQTGAFQRVGSSSLENVDVRIICATNRDPQAEVEAGRFREDLYYRLHVLPIALPPLRERHEDTVEIARHFLQRYAAEEGKPFTRFAPEVEEVLTAFDWPGNVRQLQNVVRNIVVLNQGETVTPAMLPAPLDQPLPASAPVARPAGGSAPAAAPSVGNDAASDLAEAIRPLAELEREAIERAVRLCDGNVPRAAHFLGISAATVYRKKSAWAAQDGGD
ncbi:MAG TPA: sigma-54 dependent transcriptional regulator [Gammaproteobacteria bacterium]